jgi:hypothetical protein
MLASCHSRPNSRKDPKELVLFVGGDDWIVEFWFSK